MSDWQTRMGAIAGLLSILCFVPYIIAIIKGKAKPSRTTWWIWTILGTVISLSMYFSGSFKTIWLPICGGIGQFIIALLSIRYGEGGWNRFDRFCVSGVIISLFLWWQFGSPLIALLLNILIDLLGALPTIKKTYYEPEKEDILTWSVYLLGSTFNLFAVEGWTFALAIFPLYIFSINLIIVALILRPKMSYQFSKAFSNNMSKIRDMIVK
jgi:hypothetical protein